jgi:magnesium transporter
VYFVPLALRAAHDVSVWSLAVAVKDISGKDLSGSRLRKVIGKEYACTLIEALLISALGLAVGMVWTGFRAPAYAGAAGLFVGIAFAGMLGLVVPIVIRRAKPDPAVGPERLVGVMVMAASVISFLVVSGWVVGAWR